MNTTLNKIRKLNPCTDGWEKLLNSLGKTKADNDPVLIKTILKSNGLSDALWALSAVEDSEKTIILICADIAESVAYIYNAKNPSDNTINDAIKAKRDYATGITTFSDYCDALNKGINITSGLKGSDYDAAAACCDSAFSHISYQWIASRACVAYAKYYCELLNESTSQDFDDAYKSHENKLTKILLRYL